ncbi:MAG: RluA family pseudouridine synthase [Lachnospiraceae bacterium]|nr:RluA family pseudouridine synthase [Lachnospiraceae bacterium]
MKKFDIRSDDSGMRLDKFCARILKNAPFSFIYKMLRKKNITLNGKKAKGNELLKTDDTIVFFLSDETFAGFGKPDTDLPLKEHDKSPDPDVVYEDPQVLIINKPAGILSQKAQKNDLSVNEYCIRYLQKKREYDPLDPASFQPAVCNRLDRNTSGLMLIAKTHICAQMLTRALKERTLHKYYVCIVKGMISSPMVLAGYLKKDQKDNTVTIRTDKTEGADAIETELVPLNTYKDLTLLKVKLVTGKPHQIRAHLNSIGHPILGDPKYGDSELNRRYQCNRQLLHAFRLEMPEFQAPLNEISKRVFEIPYPVDFYKYMRI